MTTPPVSTDAAPLRPSGAVGLRDEGLGSLADALDRILCKGVVVDGAVTIGVAGVDLLLLDLRLLLAAVDTVRPDGPFFCAPPAPCGPRTRPDQPERPAGFPDAAAAERRVIAPGGAAPDREAPDDSAAAWPEPRRPSDRQSPEQGLVRLVLTLVNLLHEVLEKQAIRRMANGTLTMMQVEDIGTALCAQADVIERLRRQFGLSEADLTLRLAATARDT